MFFIDFLTVSKNSDEVAIFTEALQTLGAQAGGSYSQTRIASPSTNGHRPARAAQPAPSATNPAFERPSR